MLSTKATICCLVIALSLVASTCNGEGYPPAPSCARFECVFNYTIVHSQKEFEIREYNHTVYVSSPEIHANSYKEGSSKGFKMLLDYFNGQNKQRFIMNMTSPVLVRSENSTYTAYFFLPRMYQPVYHPFPLTPDIGIYHTPYKHHKYVAVRRFDGMINDESIATNLAALKKSVENTPYQLAAKSDDSMVAAYNSPHELTNRVNEILLWFD